MLSRIIFPLIILSLAIGGFVLLKRNKPAPVPEARVAQVWRVNVITAQRRTLSPEIKVYGRIETPRKATLKSALAADVVQVNIQEGQSVTKGMVLVLLDKTDVQLQLQQRQADLAEIDALINSEQARYKRDQTLLKQQKALLKLAENAVERARKLEKTRLASQSSLDDAIAAMQRQVLTVKRLVFDIQDHPARLAQLQARKQRILALIEQTQTNLARTQVKAPFSGRIARVNVAEGDRVRIGDSLLSLYDTRALEVRAQIPNMYRPFLSQHNAITATATIDQQHYQLSLHRLAGEIRPDSGGVDGLFAFEGNTKTLRVGAFVQLTVTLPPRKGVFAMPYTALYGLDHVYIVDDGYMKRVKVDRVGERQDKDGQRQLLVVSSELHEGDQIVTTPLPNAMTGLRVEVVRD